MMDVDVNVYMKPDIEPVRSENGCPPASSTYESINTILAGNRTSFLVDQCEIDGELADNDEGGSSGDE